MTPSAPPTGRRLVRKLADSTKQCALPARTYGQCILARYQDPAKGMCAQEFALFKVCVQSVMKRKW